MERIMKIKQKILHNKKSIKSLACLLMAAALFVSLQPIKTNALSINGAGTGVVEGSGTDSGEYECLTDGSILGFRVTLVSTTGSTVNSTRPYDIYSSSLSTKDLVRFTTKYSKAELISLYGTLKFPLTTTSSSTVYDTYTISASNWGLSIPASAEAMIDWATAANMRTLLEKAWGSDTNELAAQGWAVMMEPIYEVWIKGTCFALTPTEIAIVAVSDGSAYSSPTNYWDDIPGWTSSAATWQYISGYTHGAWPQSLTLTEAQCGIDAPSETLSKSNRGTSRQIIEEGYGVMLVYSNNLGDYMVEYDGNGATSGSTASSTHTIGVSKNLTENGFVKTNHAFAGWNTKADGSGTSYADKASVTNLTTTKGAKVTLYAQWVADKYNLTIDPNGGTYSGSLASVTATYSQGDVISINAPTRTGYTFNGWVWSGNSTSFTLDQPTIGYAKSNWANTGTYKQTINSTQGYTNHKWTGISAQTSDTWNSITLSNYSISAGETVTVSGWIRINTNTTGANLNFYHGAKNNDWENCKYGVSSTDGQWQYFSFSRTFEETTTGYLQIYTGTLKGLSGDIDFDLKGISIERDDGTIVPTTLTMPASDVTLTAKWTANDYTLTIDPNGGTYNGSSSNVTASVQYGTSVQVDNPVREGYSFAGWKFSGTGVRNLIEPAVGYSYKVWTPSGSHTTTLSDDGTYTNYVWKKPSTSRSMVSFNSYEAVTGDTVTVSGYIKCNSLPVKLYLFINGSSAVKFGPAKNNSEWQYFEVEYTFPTANSAAVVCFYFANAAYSHIIDFDLKGLTITKNGSEVLPTEFTMPAGDVTLTAQWTLNDGLDEGPEITAVDRWFTLEDAKNDVITLEELMSTATAEDSPIGDITDFTEKKDNFTIIDYSEEDFRRFDKAGSVTVTYWAEDKAGNVALKTITVHIVDKNNSTAISPESSVKKQEIRFISDRYYLDAAGDFIGASSGGLDASSKWVTDNAYVDALTNTLENAYSDGNWVVKPAYSFTFDIDAIDDIKSFIETNDIGESLGAFYNAFLMQED